MDISVMLKPASSNCNLSCEYCFYRSLSEQRQEFTKGMMSTETAQKVVDRALEFADGGNVYFTFQGGEPLLRGLGFYEDFVSYVKKKNTMGCKVSFCLQTNATLIDDAYAEFFKENGFLVGASLDGDAELNSYRKFADGSDSFEDTVRGIKLLEKYAVDFNVISVLTKRTAADFRKAYRFFKGSGWRYMQFIPCLRPLDGDCDESLYMDCDDYAKFLSGAFNIYYNSLMRSDFVSIRMFDNYVLLNQGRNAEQCGMNGCCSTQFVVEGDGSVYPCDFYCTDEWYLGNINDSDFNEMYHSQKAVEFLKESFKLDEKCGKCQYFYLCRGGGCKRLRRDMDYCDSYRAFFDSCEYKLKQIKR